MCESVLCVCLTESKSGSLTASETEVFPHHADNLTPVSFSVSCPAELDPVFLFRAAFVSHHLIATVLPVQLVVAPLC